MGTSIVVDYSHQTRVDGDFSAMEKSVICEEGIDACEPESMYRTIDESVIGDDIVVRVLETETIFAVDNAIVCEGIEVG